MNGNFVDDGMGVFHESFELPSMEELGDQAVAFGKRQGQKALDSAKKKVKQEASAFVGRQLQRGKDAAMSKVRGLVPGIGGGKSSGGSSKAQVTQRRMTNPLLTNKALMPFLTKGLNLGQAKLVLPAGGKLVKPQRGIDLLTPEVLAAGAEFDRKRKRRNLYIGLGVGAVVVIGGVFFLTRK